MLKAIVIIGLILVVALLTTLAVELQETKIALIEENYQTQETLRLVENYIRETNKFNESILTQLENVIDESLHQIELALEEPFSTSTGTGTSTSTNTQTYNDICEYSISMQEKLLDEYNLPLCSLVSVRELHRLTELKIDYHLYKMRASDFASMINLYKLELYLSGSTPEIEPELIQEILTQLPKLSTLRLDNFSESILRDINFTSLSTLQHLIIRVHKIQGTVGLNLKMPLDYDFLCSEHPQIMPNTNDRDWSEHIRKYQTLESVFGITLATCESH